MSQENTISKDLLLKSNTYGLSTQSNNALKRFRSQLFKLDYSELRILILELKEYQYCKMSKRQKRLYRRALAKGIKAKIN